jgi:F-type H+-transporting ATPase subunit epsilon
MKGIMCEFVLMPRHAPLLTKIKTGEVRIRTEEDNDEFFFISGCMLEIRPQVITIPRRLFSTTVCVSLH